jgi:hypothetical protein
MSEEAIPLFFFENYGKRPREDYQLHPCYTWRKGVKHVEKPHVDLLRLSSEDETEKVPEILGIVMCLGRLFVRAKILPTRYRPRWTGYEVFVDNSLNLWMIFDKASISSPDKDRHPYRCLLSNPFRLEQYVSGEENTDFVDIARLCHLHDIDARLGASIEEVANTACDTSIRFEKLQVDQIDRRDELIFRQKSDEGGSGSPRYRWRAPEPPLGTPTSTHSSLGDIGSPLDQGRAPGLPLGTIWSKHRSLGDIE